LSPVRSRRSCLGILERKSITNDSQTFGSIGTRRAVTSKGDVSLERSPNITPNDVLIASNIVDYNSWVESDQGRRLRKKIGDDVVLAEGMLTGYTMGW